MALLESHHLIWKTHASSFPEKIKYAKTSFNFILIFRNSNSSNCINILENHAFFNNENILKLALSDISNKVLKSFKFLF